MHEISPNRDAGVTLPAAYRRASSTRIETRVLAFSPSANVADARDLVVAEAERGRWELARVVIYRGGARRIWLRRRVIPVEASLGSES